MKRFDALLRRLEAAVSLVAIAALFAIMLIVVADVFMRYVLNSPFAWAYDLVGLYLLASVFFLSLSGTFAAHAHVSVDLLLHRLGPLGRRRAETLGALVGLMVMAPIAWVGFQRMLESLAGDDRLPGALPWPTWIADALVPLGAGLLALRLLLSFIGHASSLATGRDVIALTPLSGTEAMGIE